MNIKLYSLNRCPLFGYAEPIIKVIPKPNALRLTSLQKVKLFLIDQEITELCKQVGFSDTQHIEADIHKLIAKRDEVLKCMN